MNEKDTFKMTMLLDFYGDLLTEKQREYYGLRYDEDLSLSEIADRAGISKQGVHDIIIRAEKALKEIEQKTGIIERWSETRTQLELAAREGTWLHPAVRNYFHMESIDNGV